MAHTPVKAQKLVQTAAAVLEQSLVVPSVFRREGIENFIGAKDDTINVKVEGVLPFRTYGWRNDRSTSITFDEYAERTVAVTFGDDIYNALRLTAEQSKMDFDGISKLVGKQAEAIGRGLEYKACDFLEDLTYEIELGIADSALKAGLIRARAVMNRLRVQGPRTILVGTDWEAALLEDEGLNLASNVGEDEAQAALREATLGRRYGFNFVVAQELDPSAAIALVPSAVIFATGAPEVPDSAPYGASASVNGVALTHVRDFEIEKVRDRSLLMAYQSFRDVKDILLGRDEVTGQAFQSNYEHFVRAIKLNLNGADVLPDPDGDDEKNTELGNITGIWKASDATKTADKATIQVSSVKTAAGVADTPAAPGKAARDEADPAV